MPVPTIAMRAYVRRHSDMQQYLVLYLTRTAVQVRVVYASFVRSGVVVLCRSDACTYVQQ